MESQFTTVLAKLLTDPALRLRFRTDPHRVCSALQLNDADAHRLAAIRPAQLDAQADGLLRKRFREAARLIPETMSRIGSRGFELFAEFAAEFWPEGHRRHEIDAMQFCRRLADSGVCPAARFEANALRFLLSSRRFNLRFVRESRRWTWQCLLRRKSGVRQFRGRFL